MNGASSAAHAAEPRAERVSFDDHPCLSALASCSGLAPCEPCRVALATWVVPKALLAADCGTAEQVGAFLDAYAAARESLVANIRIAAVQHEAKLAETRAALASVPPPAPASAADAKEAAPAAEAIRLPAATVPAPSAVAVAMAAQTAPLKKGKNGGSVKKPAVVPAEAKGTLDDLFSEAVSPASPDVSVTSTPNEAKKVPS